MFLIRKRLVLGMGPTFGVLFIVAVMLVTLGRGNGSVRAALAAPCSWQQVPSPQATAAHQDQLQGISASSSTNAWAVGFHLNNQYQPLTEHWNGTSWSIVASPVSNADAYFNAVATVSENDAWAVGQIAVGPDGFFSGQQDLAMHWNGIQWSRVSTPTPNPTSGELTAVAAVNANDIWAAGDVLLHWDGHNWNLVSNLGSAAFIFGMKALGSDDVWAVGESFSSTDGNAQALVLHWDGRVWNTLPTAPIVGATSSGFFSVSGSASNDIWAVGEYGNTNLNGFPLVEHWNGQTWTVVPVPLLSSTNTGHLSEQTVLGRTSHVQPNGGGGFASGAAFFAVDALSTTDAWIVGALSSTSTVGSVPVSVALMLHWNGQSWERVPGTRLLAGDSNVEAIAHAPGSNRVWGAGHAHSATTLTQSGLILSSSDDC